MEFEPASAKMIASKQHFAIHLRCPVVLMARWWPGYSFMLSDTGIHGTTVSQRFALHSLIEAEAEGGDG